METPRPTWTTHGETLKDGMREGNKSKEWGGGGLGVVTGGEKRLEENRRELSRMMTKFCTRKDCSFRGHTFARVSQPVCDSDLHL